VVEGFALKNPMEGIDVPRLERSLPDVLSQAEVEAILNQFDGELEHAVEKKKRLLLRDRAILEVLYATGMRVSELIILKQRDLLETEETVRVFGKGSKERLVPIGKSALRWIERYRTGCRRELEKKGEGQDALFLNARGRPMTRMAIWKILRRHVDAAHIKKHVSPHTFRHTTAMHLLQAGVDVAVIALWLGHEIDGVVELTVPTLQRSEPLGRRPVELQQVVPELLAGALGPDREATARQEMVERRRERLRCVHPGVLAVDEELRAVVDVEADGVPGAEQTRKGGLRVEHIGDVACERCILALVDRVPLL